METIEIAQSILYRGIWQAAEWRAQIVNEETGEILLTASSPADEDALIGVRLTTENVRQLRTLVAFADANMRRDRDAIDCYDCRTTEERLDELEEQVRQLRAFTGIADHQAGGP